jgi:hypothetical protein
MDIESGGSFNAEFTMKLFNSDGEEYSEGVEITAFKDIYVTIEHTGDENMPTEWVYYLEKCTVFDKENPIGIQLFKIIIHLQMHLSDQKKSPRKISEYLFSRGSKKFPRIS